MRSGQWSDESVEGLAELKLTELESTNQPPVALAQVLLVSFGAIAKAAPERASAYPQETVRKAFTASADSPEGFISL